MVTFTYKWFVVYYFVLATIFIAKGIVWLFNPGNITQKTMLACESEKIPVKAIRPLRYLFLFATVSLILSFFPFNPIHLIYSLCSFLLVFVTGRHLLKWEDFRNFWIDKENELQLFFRRVGGLFITIGIATSVFLYYSI